MTLFVLTIVGMQAQRVSVQASNQVIQGRNFTVTFSITDGNGKMTRQQAPNLPGCTLLYGPAASTMHSIQVYNGRQVSSSSVQYTYTYRADKAGTITIPSVEITVDGKRMTTQERRLTILPPGNSSNQRPGYGSSPFDEMDEMMEEMEAIMNQYAGGQPARPQQPAADTSGEVSPNDLIVTVDLSKNNLYEKEAVIATIQLYTKHNITNFQPTVMPQFEGFLSEELPVNNRQAQLVQFRGDNYYHVVLKKCLLYPQKSGKLTINSGSYDVTLQTVQYVSNGFYSTPVASEHPVKTRSNSVTVNVKPLPQPVPPSFNGAVGDFSVVSELTPQKLRTNEAATYTLKLTGTGNLKHLAEPVVPFPATVEQYTPTSQNDVNFVGDNISGSFTATYTFVPQEVGKLQIPSWEFTYFNPATGEYVTETIPAYEREVGKGLPAASGAVKVDTSDISDIRHIEAVDEGDLSTEHTQMFHSALYWLVYILALAALLGTVLIYRRQIKLNSDVDAMRVRKARSRAARRLRKAAQAMHAHNNDEFYGALSSALWGYLSDKLRIPASLLTRDNIAESLTAAGAPDDLVPDVIAILDECEMARFTPNHSDSEVSSLYDRAGAVLNRMERVSPRAVAASDVNQQSRYIQ